MKKKDIHLYTNFIILYKFKIKFLKVMYSIDFEYIDKDSSQTFISKVMFLLVSSFNIIFIIDIKYHNVKKGHIANIRKNQNINIFFFFLFFKIISLKFLSIFSSLSDLFFSDINSLNAADIIKNIDKNNIYR